MIRIRPLAPAGAAPPPDRPVVRATTVTFALGGNPALAVAVLVALAVRLAARAPFVEGWDGVDFALGLRDFDVASQQPHFPGYPVLIAAARLVAPIAGPLTGDPLTLVSAVAGAAATWAVGRLGGAGAAFLFALAPGPWLLGGKALSESLGLALLLWAFALARPRPAASGLVAGLLLGARLSYLPALAGWAAVVALGGGARRALPAFAAGVVAWLVPLALMTGPADLVRIGASFTAGHFETWGGALGYLEPAERVLRHLTHLWVWNLGGAAPSAAGAARVVASVLVAGALVAGARRRRGVARAALVCAAPYALFLFAGQNPDRPRHAAPLAAAAAVVAGGAPVLATAAAVATAFVASPLAREQAARPPPDTELALYVAGGRPGARVYGWGGMRLFALYGAPVDARRARTLEDVARDLERDPAPDPLFTSDVRDKRRARYCFERVATFRATPLVFPPRRAVTLFRPCDAGLRRVPAGGAP